MDRKKFVHWILLNTFIYLLFFIIAILRFYFNFLSFYSPNAEDDYNDFWHILRMVGFCLSFANSCTNPVALYCVSDAFRKHFNRWVFMYVPLHCHYNVINRLCDVKFNYLYKPDFYIIMLFIYVNLCRYLLCRSSALSRHMTYDKTHREMTITSQSTIYRRYPSKRFANQSIKR